MGKVSVLPEATELDPSDELLVVQGGVTKRVSRDLVGGGAIGLHQSTASTQGLWQFDGDLTADVGSALSVATGNELYSPAALTTGLALAGDSLSRFDQAHDANLAILGALTIQFLVRVRNRAVSSNVFLVAFGGTSGVEANNVLYAVRMEDPSCRVSVQQQNGAGNINNWNTSINIPTGDWTHLGLTRAANGVDWELFVNGVSRDSVTLSNAPTGGSTSFLNVMGNPVSSGQEPLVDISSLMIDDEVKSASEILSNARRTLPAYLRP